MEQFHSTLIEHMRILNQNKEFNQLNFKNKVKCSIIAFNSTIHFVTEDTPLNILLRHLNTYILENNKELVDTYVQNHKKVMNTLYQKIKNKDKFAKEVTEIPIIPTQVYENIHKRNAGKIEKPKFKIIYVKTDKPVRAQIIDSKDRKIKLNQIKKPPVLDEPQCTWIQITRTNYEPWRKYNRTR